MMRKILPALFCMALAAPCGAQQPSSQPAAHNVVLVMTDGLRWQELFRGADAALLQPENYYRGRSVDALKQEFLAPSPEERRQKLMPFVWGTLVKHGTLFGDRDAGSQMDVTNGFNFSYPGYSETLTGHGDPRIHSNDNLPNPNVTVLEWLNKEPGFRGKVAGFGAWEVIGGVLNESRCGFIVNVSYQPLTVPPITPRLEELNRLKAASPRIWEDEVFDAPEFDTAMEYLKAHHPRVLFLSLGETDDWAHDGNYGEYLLSAHRVDSDLRQLWDALQAIPQYRGSTALIFTTDHGRGAEGDGWQSHGQKLPESKSIFAGFLGAGVPDAGLQHGGPAVTQSQIAATLAALLGKNCIAAEPQAAPPIVLPPVQP